MSAAAAITGAVIGIAAAALTRVTRASLAEPLVPRLVNVGVLAALGVLFGALAGWRLPIWPEALAYGVAALVSALLVATDLSAHEIPHRIMWPGMLGLVVGLALAAGLEGAWARLGVALLTGLALAVVYFVIAWFGKGQFGLGDVSLQLFLGTFLGWLGIPYALVGAVGAFLVHVPVTLGALVARRAGRKAELPFGPSLIAASWLAAFLTPAVFRLLLRG
ncbi:MAG TPA: A24 family peptidase [Propionibacteriaceae bacterium]|nr:A24 family peptidase [Propionibacteriaceae bacterium]